MCACYSVVHRHAHVATFLVVTVVMLFDMCFRVCLRQNVLRFIYKYGTPVSFRFYFKAGTDTLEPRGYCFVEYSTREVCSLFPLSTFLSLSFVVSAISPPHFSSTHPPFPPPPLPPWWVRQLYLPYSGFLIDLQWLIDLLWNQWLGVGHIIVVIL